MSKAREETENARDAPDYGTLFEALPGIYLVLDRDLVIVALSRLTETESRRSRTEILGRNVFDAYPDSDPDAAGMGVFEAAYRRVLEQGVVDTVAFQKYDLKRPESEGGGFDTRYWTAVCSPVPNANGVVEYVIVRFENVTEFVARQAERETQTENTLAVLVERTEAMQAELFARVTEVGAINAELKRANAELARLNERLRELDRSKTDFFANVSHELRTPLALVLGPVARRLAAPDLDEDARRDLEIIERNARLLYRHVCDLLDVAKLEAARLGVTYSDVDLARLVRFVASNFDSVAEERGIRYRIDAPATLAAELDAEKCQRALLNLLSNAFKFTPDGGEISVLLVEDDGSAIIRVEDDGPGVPEEERASIFERFHQLEHGIRNAQPGTGLGLAIVKDFVELQHGRVDVSASELGGAEFTVTVPLHAPPGTLLENAREHAIDPWLDLTAPSRTRTVERAPRSAPAGDAPRVLVVEDNPDMSAFLVETLESAGYLVTTASNGLEGEERARAQRPDAIVTDVMMPHTSGDQMIANLRADEGFDTVPIVVLTARADEALELKLLRGGVEAYLKKPFSPDELLAKLDALVMSRRQASARLEALEQRFRATFEQAAVGIGHVAPDGTWLRVNQKLADVLGYSEEVLAKLRIEDVTLPEDRAVTQRRLDAIRAKKSPTLVFEARFVRADGETVWVSLTASLVDDAEGKPDYFILVVEDVMWRKETEERLRQAATLFASTRDGVMVTDRAGTIVAVNPAFTAITGFTDDEVIGKNARAVQVGLPDFHVDEALWEELARTGSWQGEVWSRRKSGEAYQQRLLVDSVRDGRGKVVHYVAVFGDVTTEKRAFEMEHIAHHDALTGLPNRLLLISRLNHALDHARRSGGKGAVLFLDLDEFKPVNDRLGHAAGDELLRLVSRRFSDRMRDSDTLARLGGDEFVAVLEKVDDADEATHVARALLALAAEPFVLAGGQLVSIGASIGISLFPDDASTAEALLDAADTALYRAKASGRGTYRFASEAMSRNAREREVLDSELRRALEHDEYVLHFQPLISLRDRKLIGVEALVRWQSPDRGLVYPKGFLDVAEDTGVILELGEWILRESCRAMKRWEAAGIPIGRISIKLSPRQFRDRLLVERVGTILTETGVAPASIELEIPEACLHERQQEASTTAALKTLGVRLSIDDFGTECSQLWHLRHLPIDALKVARRFVEGDVTAALVSLGKKLDLEVVAECIETEEQLRFLVEQGCDAGQGHRFCPPLPEAELAGWARAR